jgi:ABC-2 type transport system ATP-binding protein
MSSDVPDVILSLAGLRKCYGSLAAVQDLSLDVFRGEVFGFLGPNGAGKTTTIRMACGLLHSDAGRILLDGIELHTRPQEARRRIGLCPQELVIWETLTCLEQLTFVGTQYDLPRGTARARSMELLDILGLSEKANRLAKTLSGGMKRRLNLALALVHDPELLVLDEPQAGLDPQSRILVREYLQSLADTKTVLLTTHEMDEADRLATRVGVIDHGRLLVLDTPAALKKDHAGGEVLEVAVLGGGGPRSDGPTAGSVESPPALPSAWLDALPEGLTPLESLPGTLRFSGPDLQGQIPLLLERLQSVGIEPAGITLRKPTLEDVFISLTGRGLRE